MRGTGLGGPRFSAAEVVDALYRGILDRPAEPAGLEAHVGHLRSGMGLPNLVWELEHSQEHFESWLHSGDLPALATSAWRGRPWRRQEPALYFMHIMKTGGTSLNAALQSVAGLRFCLTQVFLDHLVVIPAVILEQASLVAGHLGTEALEYLPTGTVTATVLRHPVERTLSHFAHVRADPALHSEAGGLTLEEFVHSPRWRPFCENFQARNLVQRVGLREMWRTVSPQERLAELAEAARPGAPRLPLQSVFELGPLGLDGPDLRRAALDRLAGIDHVGVTEDLQGLFNRLAGTWAVADPPALPRANASADRLTAADVPPSLLEAIVEANPIDLALYEEARRRAGVGRRTGSRTSVPLATVPDAAPAPAPPAAPVAGPGPAPGAAGRTGPGASSPARVRTALPVLLGLLLTAVVAAADAAIGSGVVLIGLLVLGPCCSVPARHWRATAAVGVLALILAALLGLADGLWGTSDYALFLMTVGVVGSSATWSAAALQGSASSGSASPGSAGSRVPGRGPGVPLPAEAPEAPVEARPEAGAEAAGAGPARAERPLEVRR